MQMSSGPHGHISLKNISNHERNETGVSGDVKVG